MKKKIFIDGEEGTTGLQISEKLLKHPDIDILKIDRINRKNPIERRKLMESSDLTFFCLPDDAAKDALTIAKSLTSKKPIIIDASTAHRINPDWVYGLPELNSRQKELIANSRQISVPGCYASGATLLINPLIRNSIIPKDLTLCINAISGYSGGGKKLIEHFDKNNNLDLEPFFYYGLNLNHKHIPEIMFHNKLTKKPIFLPSVADYFQGMIVNLPLHKEWINNEFSFKEIVDIFKKEYEQFHFIKMFPHKNSISKNQFYRPDKIINSNFMHINFYFDESEDQMILSSNFDNLGKGASGAAIQCMNLVFGFPENLSLE